MAKGKRIEPQQVASPEVFEDIIKGGRLLETVLIDLEKGFKAQLQVQKELAKANPFKSAKDVKAFTDGVKATDTAYENLVKTERTHKKVVDEIAAAEAKLVKAHSEDAKKVAELNVLIAEQNKRNKEAAKETLGLVSAYQKESARLNDLRKDYKNLVIEQGKETKVTKEMRLEIERLDKKLKDVDASVGQFQRSVGDYKNQMKGAIQETGLLNGVIGQTVINVVNLGRGFGAAAKGAGGLGAAFKALGIGLILAAIAAIVGVLTAAKDASQKLTDTFDEAQEKVLAFSYSFGSANKAISEFYEALIKSRPLLRALSDDIQQLGLDQEDLAEISADTTIGYEERNRALLSSFDLAEKKAKKEIEVAKINLELADKLLAKEEAKSEKGEALAEFYDKQRAANQALVAAEDVLNDKTRQNATALRARALQQASLEIDLLLKKKLAAKEAEAILANQIKDERNQLEDRRRFADDLLKKQRETTAEEIKIFKQKTGIQFDESKFLEETDAIKLQNQLTSIKQINEEGIAIGIGEDAIRLLAKITVQYQNQSIENKEYQAKLDAEALERTQKLADIQRKIGLDNLEFDLELLQQEQDDAVKSQEGTQERLLKADILFNMKTRQLRQQQIEREIAATNDLYEKKREILNATAEDEKQNIRDSIFDNTERATKIAEIENKLKNDKYLLNLEEQEAHGLFVAKIIEQNGEIRDAEITQIQEIVTAFHAALDRRDEAESAYLDRQQEKRNRSLETQQSLFEKGLDNQLAFEQQKQAEIELKREELAEKQERRAKVLAYFNAFAEYLKSNPDTAALKALAQVAIADLIAGSFFEGTEDTGGAGDLDSKGGKLAVIHPHERIMDAMNNAKIDKAAKNLGKPKIGNNELADLVLQVSAGEFSGVKYVGSQFDDTELLKEVRGMRQDIKGIEPPQLHFDQLGTAYTTAFHKGIRTVTKHLGSRPRIKG